MVICHPNICLGICRDLHPHLFSKMFFIAMISKRANFKYRDHQGA